MQIRGYFYGFCVYIYLVTRGGKKKSNLLFRDVYELCAKISLNGFCVCVYLHLILRCGSKAKNPFLSFISRIFVCVCVHSENEKKKKQYINLMRY